MRSASECSTSSPPSADRARERPGRERAPAERGDQVVAARRARASAVSQTAAR